MTAGLLMQTEVLLLVASNSGHTLKIFYLERGYWDSNFAMYFNLQLDVTDQIYKVDEPISKITTSSNGYGSILDSEGNIIDFREMVQDNISNSGIFILREVNPPNGYRANSDIVLKYYKSSDTFKVLNKYEVGAYASFTSKWTSEGEINKANYNPSTGEVANVLVIPVIRQGTSSWLPMYGSNTAGWNTVSNGFEVTENGDFEKNLAIAAFMQIATGAQDWYLRWNNEETRLTGELF